MKFLLNPAYQEKAEREALAAKCGQMNVEFLEKFKTKNAEWEAEKVYSTRLMELMSRHMMKKSSGDKSPMTQEMLMDMARAASDKSAPKTLPPADNMPQLITAAKAQLEEETKALSKAEQYAFCEQKLEKLNEPPPGALKGPTIGM